MTKLFWTRHPQSDVDARFNYIANESHIYALRTIESIESAASAATRMPESGGIVSEFYDSSIHEVLAERYRIIYRVRNNYRVRSSNILVLTVLHGARNLTALLDQN